MLTQTIRIMRYTLSLLTLLIISNQLKSQPISRIDSLINVAEQSGDSVQVKIFGDLCWDLKFSNPQLSVKFGKKAINAAGNANSSMLSAQAHSDLGMVYYLTSDYPLAKLHYDTSLFHYGIMKDTLGLAKITGRIGAIHQKLGRLDLALEKFLDALKLSNSIGHEQLASYDMNNIAIVYMDQLQYDKALDYFLESLRIKEKLNDQYQISGTLLNIGSLHQYTGNFEKALEYYDKSIEMCRKVGQTEYLSAALNNYGGLLVELGQYSKAEKPLRESIAIRTKSGDRRGLTSSLVNLGRANSALKHYTQAKQLLDQALTIAIDLNARDAIQKSYQAISEMLASMGRYREAYQYQGLFVVARDSFLNEQSTKQLAEMRTRFETEEKEQEIRDLNRERTLQASLIREKDLEIQRNSILAASAILVLMALLIISYLYYHRRRLKQQAIFEQERAALKGEQLQAVINSQESERKRFAMDLHDDFGQLISALRINLNHINDKMESEVQKANVLLDDMYASLKSIAFNLMPQTLVEKGLEPALSELCHQLDELGQMKFTLRAYNTSELEFSDVHKVAIYRVVQEIVNNVIKYSGATKVDINITGLDNELSIMIEDDGEGFDPNILKMGRGNGWRNIGSRLDMMSAEIDYDSKVGRRNTTVSLIIPYVSQQKFAA